MLLETLRQETGCSDLSYLQPPVQLSGGFYAEMLRFRLAGAPPELDRELVARMMPDPAAGAWETTIQRAVAEQGFPTPRVRLSVPETSPLGRYLIVMDHIDGRPPMAGLSFGRIATQIPYLFRHLPDQLAGIAADLHALDPEPLAARLEALGGPIPTTTAGFVAEQAGLARLLGQPEVARAGEQLLAAEPPSDARAITHGDLHPFNLLITSDGPALIDWTVSRVAHPGFTLGFADLMLTNPPIHFPGVVTIVLAPVLRSIAKRFLVTYRRLTEGTPAAVDGDQLDWHRRVHALRILTELAGWQAAGTGPVQGHPWLALQPVARRVLGLPPA
ncbi:MAG: hypothetical protein EDR02_18370 [Actinobacteria bacterium]|nr:MAG: hypothetical protein EDR02_18370 [Actinomycetota bacterium]